MCGRRCSRCLCHAPVFRLCSFGSGVWDRTCPPSRPSRPSAHGSTPGDSKAWFGAPVQPSVSRPSRAGSTLTRQHVDKTLRHVSNRKVAFEGRGLDIAKRPATKGKKAAKREAARARAAQQQYQQHQQQGLVEAEGEWEEAVNARRKRAHKEERGPRSYVVSFFSFFSWLYY